MKLCKKWFGCVVLFTLLAPPLYGATYFVSTNGMDASGRDGLSRATAWATLPYAANRVPAGTTGRRQIIRLSGGVFQQTSSALLPGGVNVQGAGSGSSFINANWTNTEAELSIATAQGRLIQIRRAGNNQISDISFLGNHRRAGGALWVENSTNLEFLNLTFTNFGSATLVLATNCAFVTVSNATFSECGYESTNYSLGMIQLVQVRDSLFTHLTMVSTLAGTSYGFKASGLNGHGSDNVWVARTVFDHLNMNLKPIQAYQNSGFPNFSLEFFMTAQSNNELRYSHLANTVSQSSPDTTVEGTTATMRIHDNVFDLPETAYAIECKTHRLEIDHNTFRGGYGVMNDWTCGTADMDRLDIHDNLAEEAGEWFFSFTGAPTNLRLRHNTVYFANKPSHASHVFLNNCNMGKTIPRNFDVRDNLAVAPASYPGEFYKVQNGNTLTPINVTFANNTCSNLTFTPPARSK